MSGKHCSLANPLARFQETRESAFSFSCTKSGASKSDCAANRNEDITLISSIEKNFAKIGAKVNVVTGSREFRSVAGNVPVSLNIINTDRGGECFQVAIRPEFADQLQLSVLEVQPKDRHLVLLARVVDNSGNAVTKDHFLCGFDERHLFVASVEAVSSVAAAKASLKPRAIIEQETGMNNKQSNRRKNKVFRRQGEWFFIPVEINPNPAIVRKNEPLRRGLGGGKPHIAQFGYRAGGETVRVCREHPAGLNSAEYRALIETNPRARFFNWRDMQRNATAYVKGTIKHPDHATIVLHTWHQVWMNTERRSAAIAFLD